MLAKQDNFPVAPKCKCEMLPLFVSHFCGDLNKTILSNSRSSEWGLQEIALSHSSADVFSLVSVHENCIMKVMSTNFPFPRKFVSFPW